MDPARSQQVANLFGQGPVLLFVDGSDPAHRGLTDAMRSAVVCVQLAGPNDRQRLVAATEFLDVTFGGEGGIDHQARIAMKAVFCFARRVGGQPHVIQVPNLPKCLGEQAQLNLMRLLSAANILPPQPVWSYPDAHAELDAQVAATPPDKKTALDRLRTPTTGVWLLLRPEADGLRLAADVAHLPEHALFLAPETVWQRLVERGCVAFVPAPPLPQLLVLSPPHRATPREALQRVQDHGAGMVLVDCHRAHVEVPASLRGQPIVAVPIGILGITAMVVAEADGLTATMPDADGRPALLRAPWAGVLTVSSMGGIAHGTWSWPEHATPELQAAVTTDAGLDGKIAFDQPCGPRQPQGQPMIRVEFHARRGVH